MQKTICLVAVSLCIISTAPALANTLGQPTYGIINTPPPRKPMPTPGYYVPSPHSVRDIMKLLKELKAQKDKNTPASKEPARPANNTDCCNDQDSKKASAPLPVNADSIKEISPAKLPTPSPKDIGFIGGVGKVGNFNAANPEKIEPNPAGDKEENAPNSVNSSTGGGLGSVGGIGKVDYFKRDDLESAEPSKSITKETNNPDTGTVGGIGSVGGIGKVGAH